MKRIDLSAERIRLYESKHKNGEVVMGHHHQVYQILYALEGEGEISIDGTCFKFRQDNCAVIVPFSNHSFQTDSKLTILVLEFDKTTLDVMIRNELLENFFRKSQFICINLFNGNKVRQLLRKMLSEESYGNVLHVLAMRIYLSELLLVFARVQNDSQIENANSLRAERIRNFIDTHYNEIRSSNDISNKLEISARHINNIFKEKYNMTPLQYLTEIRIELATKLLTETDEDIVSICYDIGFETVSTFYRTFKNIMKISPNKYRQVHRIAKNVNLFQ